MKSSFKSFLCILLCAMLIIPGTIFITAEGSHVHASAETDASEDPETSDTTGTAEEPAEPEPQDEITTGTEEQIESARCKGEGAKDGHHELYSPNEIIFTTSGATRANRNQKAYENSCTEAAYTSSERPCRYCNEWFTVIVKSDDGEPTGHKFGDEEVSESNTCDGQVYTTKVCETCGYVEVTVDGKAVEEADLAKHENTTTRTVKHEGNCGIDVVEITECEDCHQIIACKDLGQAGHSGVFKTTKNGTCTENGTRSLECSVCKKTVTREIKTVGIHTYGDIYEKAPTCTEPGTATRKCIHCGTPDSNKPEQFEVPAKGHVWKKVASNVCSADIKEICTVCGETKTTSGVEPDHDWGDEITVPATCTEAGYTYHQCKKCGIKVHMKENVEPIAEHKFFASEVVEKETCGTPGIYRRKCADCGTYGETYTVPATGKHPTVADDGDCTTAVICPQCHTELVAAEESHNIIYTQISSAFFAEKYHTKSCSNENCKYSEKEKCVSSNDTNCVTVPTCDLCGGNTRVSKPHASSGKFIPYPGEEDDYHIELCLNCSGYYGQKIAHKYVDGKCTVCDHVEGRPHTPDGVWQSDGTFHWQTCSICGGQTLLERHDKTADSDYEGSCAEAVKCSVCEHIVREAAASHNYSGEWQSSDEFHYRTCTNPGCNEHEVADHNPVDDGDCTTSNYCADCHYEVVKGGTDHSWVVDETGHTDKVHKMHCSNDGCNETKEEEHTVGIEATCKSRAECTACHSEFGELAPDNHIGGTEIRDAKPATTEEEGYTGDTYCLGCGAKIAEGSPIEKLTAEHTHDYTKWECDGETHRKVCECGAVDEDSIAVHTFGGWTYDDASTHSRTCSVCEYVERERHEHEADPQDCTADINCVDCDAVLVPASAEEHDFTGRAVGTAEGHVFSCVHPNCSVTSPVFIHEGGISSCQSGAHCDICGFEYLVKNPDIHTGGTEIRNQKNATETEKGYTGDTYCLGCNTLIEKGTDIEKLPAAHVHEYGAWMSDMTHHWRDCSCGDRDGYAEHAYEKGVCTVCGAKDPTYGVVPEILVDTENGITAEFPPEEAEFYDEIELVVDKMSPSDEDFSDIKESIGQEYEEFIPFDITLYNVTTEEKVQPNSKLTIKIPLPQKWEADKVAVYHVAETEKTLIEIKVSDSVVTFTVDHLSYYVLVNTASDVTGPTPPATTDPADTTDQKPADTTEPVTTDSKPADTTEPVTTDSKPADTTEPVTTDSKPADTTEPTPADTTAPKPDDTTEPTPADTTAPKPDDTTEPTPADTTAPKPDDTTEPTPADTTAPKPDDTTEPTPADTTAPKPDDTTAPTPADTTSPKPDDTTEPTPADTTAPTPADTTGATPADTTGATPDDTTEPTPADTTGSAATETTAPGTTGPSDDPRPPQTGDIPMIAAMTVALLASGAGIALSVGNSKKRR